MVVAIKCKSLLLEKTLSIFLKDYLGTSDKCNILISDGFIKSKNKLFIVSDRDDANMSLPFSKEELLDALKRFYKQYSAVDLTPNFSNSTNPSLPTISSLEKEIQSIMKDYTKKIVTTIKKHQGNTSS